ncbi:hypothetical protein MKW94_003087 [Papaver nudicaule]|uniref:MBD domain-containing protein n=1 Tax=Papaver nudicaule TaxID=74823 RepID=A0AA41SG94_PAPNU|nr:hypothetical protein [Papaver nudicaule]
MAIVDTMSSTSKPLQLESLPLIDLRSLSQSELNSLSLCTSNDTFDLTRCDDIIIPKIDRSVFNESAGSKKQTYSRLNFAPPEHELSHHNNNLLRNRRFSSSSSGTILPKNPSLQNPNFKNPNFVYDYEKLENKQIVNHLRGLFGCNTEGTRNEDELVSFGNQSQSFDELVVYQEEPMNEVEGGNGFVLEDEFGFEDGERKRKRGRPRKYEPIRNRNQSEKVVDESKSVVAWAGDQSIMDKEIMNKNGDVVDVVALGTSNDPFSQELRNRTAGLETDDELLGYLRALDGQWASTRKKRKIVDASDFGDHLPKGWKLLLSLKRKEGRVWVYCRRYISPSGHHFLSTKEVSSYLHSVFGTQDTNQPNTYSSAEIGVANNLATGRIANLLQKDGESREDLIHHQASIQAPIFTEHENLATPFRDESLALVEANDRLVCHKCNTTYADKDAYLQHLLTSHQSKNKSRLCTSISDGVIIKDGKYECQFCHKIFLEKHRYNGHVGNHVKAYVRRLESSTGKAAEPKRLQLSPLGVTPSVIFKGNEILDNDKVSMLHTFRDPKEEMHDEAPRSILVGESVTEALNAKTHCDKMNIEDLRSASGTDSITGTLTDPNVVKPHGASVADSSPGPLNAKSDVDEMNGEKHRTALVVESAETLNAKSDDDEMNVDPPQSTAVSDSALGTFKCSTTEILIEIPLTTTGENTVENISETSFNHDGMDVEAPHSATVAGSAPETHNAQCNYGERNDEASNGTPVRDSVQGPGSAKPNNDKMNVEAACYSTLDMDVVPETLICKPTSDRARGAAPYNIPVTDSHSGKANHNEMNAVAPYHTLDMDSVCETRIPKSNCDLMSVEAPHSVTLTDSAPVAADANYYGGNISGEARCSTPTFEVKHKLDAVIVGAPDSFLGMLNAKSDHQDVYDGVPQSTSLRYPVQGVFSARYEMDHGASPHITTFAGSVTGNSSAKLNYGELNTGAPPHCAPFKDSVLRNLNAKSYFDDMIVQAPSCTPATQSIPETSAAKSYFDEMNVEPPSCTPATQSIPETSTAKPNWGLHLASSFSKQGSGADKMNGTLADGYYDKQQGNYATTANKLGEIHDHNSNMFGTFNPLLYSQPMSSERLGASKASTGEYVFGTSGQSDKYGLHQERFIERVGASKTSNAEYVYGSGSGQNDKCGPQQEAGSESCWLSLSIGQQINDAAASVDEVFSLIPKESQFSEVKESDNNEPGNFFGTRDSGRGKDVLTIGSIDEGNLLETLELAKSSNCFPTFNMVSDKVEKVSDFEELRLDDMESSRFGSFMGQGLGDIENSINFDWASMIPNMESRPQLTPTVCVWCGLVFNIDVTDSATEYNSVGYMCPTCKNRISGHL